MERYGAYIERGIIIRIEEQGFVVRSYDRDGITTPPIKPIQDVSLSIGDQVYYHLHMDGTGRIICPVNGFNPLETIAQSAIDAANEAAENAESAASNAADAASSAHTAATAADAAAGEASNAASNANDAADNANNAASNASNAATDANAAAGAANNAASNANSAAGNANNAAGNASNAANAANAGAGAANRAASAAENAADAANAAAAEAEAMINNIDDVPTEDSDNLVKSGGVFAELQNKQDTLTFDNTPTPNSDNPVKSDGIARAIEAITPVFHTVELNPDGTVYQASATLVYSTILANLTGHQKADYLDVLWGSTRFFIKCSEIVSVSNGDLKFEGLVEYNGIQRYIVFTLTPNDVFATTDIRTFESISNKIQDIIANALRQDLYPSAWAVFRDFQRKPKTIWEVDGVSVTTGLTALETDMSASPAWQLTNLDFSPFKRVKIYTRAAQKSGITASASTTPAMILEMSLDSRAAIAAYGGHFLASMVEQKSNDRNRLATLCCAISADKTSFACMRMTNIYGTGVTDNSDVGAWVFKIEGYYD